MQTKFVPPAQRVEDLTEWEDENEIDGRLRDLPARFAIRAGAIGLDAGTETLVRQFKNPDNQTLGAEAKRKLAKLQLLVLNLMLYCSGYRGEAVTTPVANWDTALLVGDDMQATNFGNMPLQSRQSENSRHANPVSPTEGWMYRMIDFKDNFFMVLKGLNFYNPKPELGNAGALAQVAERTDVQWAHKLIKQLAIVPEMEPVAKA